MFCLVLEESPSTQIFVLADIDICSSISFLEMLVCNILNYKAIATPSVRNY